MKKFGLLILIIFGFANISTATPNKNFDILIDNYDLSEELRENNDMPLHIFWRKAIEENQEFQRFNNSITKNNGAEKEALAKLSELPRFYPQYDESIVQGYQNFCDSILNTMGINPSYYHCSLHIVNSPEPNSFVAPTETGFAICLTTGLIFRKGISTDIILGYVANEFTHGVLKHPLRALYQYSKTVRSERITAGVVAGLNAFATGMASQGSSPAETMALNKMTQNENAKMFADIPVSTLKQVHQYQESQIYESDLLAYRFMAKRGLGQSYIEGLKIKGAIYNPYLDMFESSCEDNPSLNIQKRINFLNYAIDNPKLKQSSKNAADNITIDSCPILEWATYSNTADCFRKVIIDESINLTSDINIMNDGLECLISMIEGDIAFGVPEVILPSFADILSQVSEESFFDTQTIANKTDYGIILFGTDFSYHYGYSDKGIKIWECLNNESNSILTDHFEYDWNGNNLQNKITLLDNNYTSQKRSQIFKIIKGLVIAKSTIPTTTDYISAKSKLDYLSSNHIKHITDYKINNKSNIDVIIVDSKDLREKTSKLP